MLNANNRLAIDNEAAERPTNWSWGGSISGPTLPLRREVGLVPLPEAEQQKVYDKVAQGSVGPETSLEGDQNRMRALPTLAYKHVGIPVKRAFLQPLQEWEGYVTEITGASFFARLLDVTAGSKVEEESAEFLIEDVADADLQLLREGAIFRWVIGYLRDANGSKRRVSQIVFRRLPAWTRMDLLSADQRARAMGTALVWED